MSNDFSNGSGAMGYEPLGPRAYELFEERQRFEENRDTNDCLKCKVHPVFKENLCVHCYCHEKSGGPR